MDPQCRVAAPDHTAGELTDLLDPQLDLRCHIDIAIQLNLCAADRNIEHDAIDGLILRRKYPGTCGFMPHMSPISHALFGGQEIPFLSGALQGIEFAPKSPDKAVGKISDRVEWR